MTGSPTDTQAGGQDRTGLLRALFRTGIEAVDPAHLLPPRLPPAPERGSIILLAFGKAALPMARVAARHYRGHAVRGLVVVPAGTGDPANTPPGLDILEAGHPDPDDRSVAAARACLELARSATADDLVLCLISGGGSALLCLPAPGVTLAGKRSVTSALLRAGARIGEINRVRRHLSSIKGGRLAKAARPAKCVTLIVSDVPGDDPKDVASGPTVPDPTTLADARAVLERYRIPVPIDVARHLASPDAETPKPGDPAFADNTCEIVASAATALRAMADAAKRAGFSPIILGDAIEGEAAFEGVGHARLARGLALAGARTALISGGELTVDVGEHGGTGGPNMEYVLAGAQTLEGAPGIWLLAGDSDGADGSTRAAGAIAGPDLPARAGARGLDLADALARHDVLPALDALGALLVTGPTGTNVNDLRAILIDAEKSEPLPSRPDGRLVLVVGPSGAGKDSLLDGARAQLAGDPTFVFPRRFITRPGSVPGEPSHFLTEEAFRDIETAGGFALSWAAHGLNYGIDGGVLADLARGRTVAVNVSRTVIEAARQRFARLTVVVVTAPADVLAARLERRGRETADEIAERVARAALGLPTGPDVVTIDNDGPLERAVAAFIAVLRRPAKAT